MNTKTRTANTHYTSPQTLLTSWNNQQLFLEPITSNHKVILDVPSSIVLNDRLVMIQHSTKATNKTHKSYVRVTLYFKITNSPASFRKLIPGGCCQCEIKTLDRVNANDAKYEQNTHSCKWMCFVFVFLSYKFYLSFKTISVIFSSFECVYGH